MAATQDYAEFVSEQVRDTGDVRYRKMFGEYMVYVDNKPLLLVCDNTVYVKILPCLDEVMRGADRGTPYAGAKEHYILDIENRDLTAAVIALLLPVVPVPKPRVKAKAKSDVAAGAVKAENTAKQGG